MVKFLFILLSTILLSCSYFNEKDEITEQDIYAYEDYVEYLKITRNAQKSVLNNFGADKNYKYYYKEFKEIDVKVLIFKNLLLNQQYVVIYSDYLKNNSSKYKAAKSVKALNLKHSLNKEALDAYILVEEFIEPKIEKRIKKIFIGNEMGGAIANILALSLIANSDFNKDDIEVISFGAPNFISGGKKLEINTSFINLETDENIKMSVQCCEASQGKVLNLKPSRSLKQTDVLMSYQSALKNTTLTK